MLLIFVKTIHMLFRLLSLLTLTAFCSFTANAQSAEKKAFLKEAATYVCDCFDESAEKNQEMSAEMAVGFCMITFLQDNPEGAKMAFGDFNLTDEVAMTRIGEELGVAMAAACPTTLMKLAGLEEEVSAPAEESRMSGELVSVDFGELTVVTIRKESGQTVRFYWLEYFPGADRMTGSDRPTGRTVSVKYRNADIFSGKDKEYATRRVITGIEIE